MLLATVMALASSSALLLRKRVAAVTVFVGLISTSCFAQPVFFTVPSTPYDRQMTRVHPVLASSEKESGPISLLTVHQWMTELRAIPYRYSSHWQTPAEVGWAQATDCKGKAVSLYAQMRRNGAKNVRVVIGKLHTYASTTHAWLEWDTKEGDYVLDPTFHEMPIRTALISPASYVPFYAYDGEHKYRAASAVAVAPTAKVTASYSKRFYVRARAGSTLAQSRLMRPDSRNVFSTKTQYLAPGAGHPQPDTQHAWLSARRSLANAQIRKHPTASIRHSESGKYVTRMQASWVPRSF